MELHEFMICIRLPEAGQLCVQDSTVDEGFYRQMHRLFYEDEEEFFKIMNGCADKEKLFLYLYVRFAVDLYRQYSAAGVSDQIYYDTFSDFTIWFQHCTEREHTAGLIEEHWLKRHLKMKLFRLGRLQFEKDEKTKRIHVHIPEGEPLSPESCDESFGLAEVFFDRSYTLFDCESWLLAPALLELLDAESYIIQFQKRFRIERVNEVSRQAEERVFGEIRQDKTLYPENTSLQRALKKYVLTGKNPGAGIGIIARA